MSLIRSNCQDLGAGAHLPATTDANFCWSRGGKSKACTLHNPNDAVATLAETWLSVISRTYQLSYREQVGLAPLPQKTSHRMPALPRSRNKDHGVSVRCFASHSVQAMLLARTNIWGVQVSQLPMIHPVFPHSREPMFIRHLPTKLRLATKKKGEGRHRSLGVVGATSGERLPTPTVTRKRTSRNPCTLPFLCVCVRRFSI